VVSWRSLVAMLLELPGSLGRSASCRHFSTRHADIAPPDTLPALTHALLPTVPPTKKLVEIQDVRRILQDVRAQLQDVPPTKGNELQDVRAQIHGMSVQQGAPPAAKLVETQAKWDEFPHCLTMAMGTQAKRDEKAMAPPLGCHQLSHTAPPNTRAPLSSSTAGIASPPAALRVASPISLRLGSTAKVGLPSSWLLNKSSAPRLSASLVSAPLSASTNGAQLLGSVADAPDTSIATGLRPSQPCSNGHQCWDLGAAMGSNGHPGSAPRIFGTNVAKGSSYFASTHSVPRATGFGGLPSNLRNRAKSVSSIESNAVSPLGCGDPSVPHLLGETVNPHIANHTTSSIPLASLPQFSSDPSPHTLVASTAPQVSGCLSCAPQVHKPLSCAPHIDRFFSAVEQLKSSMQASLDFDLSVPCVTEVVPATDYQGNPDDPMDATFALELQNLNTQSLSQLSIARSGHGLYYVDGRPISISWKGGSVPCRNDELLVRELDIGDSSATSSLQSYLQQAANVNIALHGRDGNYVARLPPESRLTFADTACGQQTSDLNELGVYDRCTWMRLACEQASLRESNAKAIGRTKFKI